MRTLQEIKDTLWGKAYQNAIRSGGRGDSIAKLTRGMDAIPVSRMIAKFNHIDEVVLPQIAAKAQGGETSPEWQSFHEIAEFLLWAIFIADRYEAMMRKTAEANQLLEFFQEKAAFYEAQLLKYTTLEDLLFTDSLDAYAQAIAKQADGLRSKKSAAKK